MLTAVGFVQLDQPRFLWPVAVHLEEEEQVKLRGGGTKVTIRDRQGPFYYYRH